MTASGSRIAEIAARHVMVDAFDGPTCNECRDVWPCDASILAAMLTRFAQSVADTSNDPHLVREATALLAALEGSNWSSVTLDDGKDTKVPYFDPLWDRYMDGDR